MIRKRVKVDVGDVFEATLGQKKFWIQFLGVSGPSNFPTIRVFRNQSINPESILFAEVCFGINPPIRNGDFVPVMKGGEIVPPMGNFVDRVIKPSKTGIVIDRWLLHNGTDTTDLGPTLPSRYYDYPTLTVHSWHTLQEAIEAGKIDSLAKDVMYWR